MKKVFGYNFRFAMLEKIAFIGILWGGGVVGGGHVMGRRRVESVHPFGHRVSWVALLA